MKRLEGKMFFIRLVGLLVISLITINSCSNPISQNEKSNLTDASVSRVVNEGDIPLWTSWTPYSVGDLIKYDGKVYSCVQAHTSQDDWLPSYVPALWIVTDVVQGQSLPYIKLWSGTKEYTKGEWVEYNNTYHYARSSHSAQQAWNPQDASSIWAEIPANDVLPDDVEILFNGIFNWKVGGWPTVGSDSTFYTTMWHQSGLSASYAKFSGKIIQDITGKLQAGEKYYVNIGIRAVKDTYARISLEQKTGSTWSSVATTGWELITGKGEPRWFTGADGMMHQNPLGEMQYIKRLLTAPDNIDKDIRFVIETDRSRNTELVNLKGVTFHKTNFVKANGEKLELNGKDFVFKGIAFTNFYYEKNLADKVGGSFYYMRHHSDTDFFKIKEMGYNSIRFGLNANWFENGDVKSDKKGLWTWLDRSIDMAEKYGLGIIIDMHEPVGKSWLSWDNITGTSIDSKEWLWNDQDKIDQLLNIWDAIAERYKYNDTIMGYGILNEPMTADHTGEQWFGNDKEKGLAQELIDTVRKHDKNHLIVLDDYCGSLEAYPNAAQMTTILKYNERVYPDNNILYDRHFYEMGYYTHKAAGWGGGIDNGSTYPDEHAPLGKPIWDRHNLANGYSWSTSAANGLTTDIPTSSWKTVFTPEYTPSTGHVVLEAKAVVDGALGEGNSVLFDNFKIWEKKKGSDKFVEIRNVNSVRPMIRYSKNTEDGFSGWTEGSIENPDSSFKRFTEGDGDSSSVGITNNLSKAVWNQSWTNIAINPDSKYKFSVSMKLKGSLPAKVKAGPVLEAVKDPKGIIERGFTKDSLRRYINNYILKFQNENNVPDSFFEFGAILSCFKDLTTGADNGGEQWVKDVVSIFNENDSSWAIWAFRNKTMGMFNNESERAGDYKRSVNWYDDTQKNIEIYNTYESVIKLQ